MIAGERPRVQSVLPMAQCRHRAAVRRCRKRSDRMRLSSTSAVQLKAILHPFRRTRQPAIAGPEAITDHVRALQGRSPGRRCGTEVRDDSILSPMAFVTPILLL